MTDSGPTGRLGGDVGVLNVTVGDVGVLTVTLGDVGVLTVTVVGDVGVLTLTVGGDVGSSKSLFSESASCLLFFILSRRSPGGLSADLGGGTGDTGQQSDSEVTLNQAFGGTHRNGTVSKVSLYKQGFHVSV